MPLFVESEWRHKQLLAICEQKGSLHLPKQALRATRRWLARRQSAAGWSSRALITKAS